MMAEGCSYLEKPFGDDPVTDMGMHLMHSKFPSIVVVPPRSAAVDP